MSQLFFTLISSFTRVNMTIKIVLVEPHVPGNIGAVARVMKNFGFKDLVLINPQTAFTDETYKFALKAQDLLTRAETYHSLEEFLPKVVYVLGTTARICTDRGSTDARIAISSYDQRLRNIIDFQGDVAILFGREDSGLTNEEINLCDMTVHIPTSEEYKALNLAQAVAIILYSINRFREMDTNINYREAKKEEKELLIEWFSKAVSVLGIHDWKAEHLIRRFQNIIGRAFISGKEAYSLVGVFSRTYNRIKELEAEKK